MTPSQTHQSLQRGWNRKQARGNDSFLSTPNHLQWRRRPPELLHHKLRKGSTHPRIPLFTPLQSNHKLERRKPVWRTGGNTKRHLQASGQPGCYGLTSICRANPTTYPSRTTLRFQTCTPYRLETRLSPLVLLSRSQLSIPFLISPSSFGTPSPRTVSYA